MFHTGGLVVVGGGRLWIPGQKKKDRNARGGGQPVKKKGEPLITVPWGGGGWEKR